MFCRRLSQGEAHHAVEHVRIQRILTPAITAHADARLLFDCDRQHITIVVIGMFAQQIDAAGRLPDCLGHTAKYCLKTAHRLALKELAISRPLVARVGPHSRRTTKSEKRSFGGPHSMVTSTCCNSRALSSGSTSIAKNPAAISVPARYLSRSRVR